MKRLASNIFVLCIALIAGLVIAELIARAAAPPIMHPTRIWARAQAMTSNNTVQDTPGVFRNVTVQYFENGFKRWGDINTSKKKVLVLGDSFTEMIFVNNGEEWYSYLERTFPNTEFFVYGVGGYGTTQEYMALDEYMDIIKPDVIIWQFYFNDFINDYYPADRHEFPLNDRSLRPYFEQGKIVYRIPTPFGWLRAHSALTNDVMQVYERFAFDYWMAHKVQFYNEDYGADFWSKSFEEAQVWESNFSAAKEATAEALAAARKRAPNTLMYLFSADDRLQDAERNITAEYNITYIGGVTELLSAANEKGEKVYVVNDRHWNKRGNELAGEFLVDFFNTTKVLH